MGGKDNGDVEAEPLPQGFGSSFSDRSIRMKFVRKVYAILLIQLLVTTGIVAIFILTPVRGLMCSNNPSITESCQHSNISFYLYIVGYVIFFITYFAIACCERVRKKSPGNIIAITIFTLSLSVMVAMICLYHDVIWVMMAMGITAALCLGLTLFSFQTKIDFTGLGPYLFIAMWCLLIFGIMAIIFSTTNQNVLLTVYSSLMALLFSLFLVYDTQRIMGGKKHSISPEEHVLASIHIYIDVVYIFLAILGIGGRN